MNEEGGCKSVGSERAREKKRKRRFVLSTLKTFSFPLKGCKLHMEEVKVLIHTVREEVVVA